jgi:hypothetical protein
VVTGNAGMGILIEPSCVSGTSRQHLMVLLIVSEHLHINDRRSI